MKKILILALTILLLATGCSTEEETEITSSDKQIEITEMFTEDLSKGNYQALTENYAYSTDMKTAVNEKLFSDLIEQLTAGEFESLGNYVLGEVQGYPQVSATFVYSDAEFVLNVIFDKTDNELIAGINIGDYKKKQ
jgi:PBP1b-binding outer membrane lipoprotein LpoB